MSRYVPNPFRVANVEGQGLALARVKEKAEEVKGQAEEIAPENSGFYAEHFVMLRFGRGYRVGNRDPFSHLIEWGSIHNEPYAPLRRAIAAAGLHLHEAPKP